MVSEYVTSDCKVKYGIVVNSSGFYVSCFIRLKSSFSNSTQEFQIVTSMEYRVELRCQFISPPSYIILQAI